MATAKVKTLELYPATSVSMPASAFLPEVIVPYIDALQVKTRDDTAADGTLVVKIKLLPAIDGSYVLDTATVARIKIIGND